MNDSEQYAQSGPGIIVSLHPALGPLWEVMAQKLRNGVLDTGSELRLDVAEADVEGLSVKVRWLCIVKVDLPSNR